MFFEIIKLTFITVILRLTQVSLVKANQLEKMHVKNYTQPSQSKSFLIIKKEFQNFQSTGSDQILITKESVL